MDFSYSSQRILAGFLLWIMLLLTPALAGVSRPIQARYQRSYENKALFLKIPIFGERQFVQITGPSFRAEAGVGAPRFKVGDQLRVLGIDFGGDEIRFKMGALSGISTVEIVFKFDLGLQESFPNSDVFDRALESTFTEGLKYADLEEAKRTFVQDQFEQAVGAISVSANTNRDVVLKNIAPRVPAFQEAQREIESLKGRNHDTSTQLNAAIAENRKLDADLKNQQAEIARLRTANAGLQEKIDSSTSQLSKLGDDLRNVRGAAQGYQKELASIQRSLNLKVDTNRDLAAQIGELGQVMRKLQKDNEALDGQNGALRSTLEAQQASNNSLTRENDDLKLAGRQMQDTIKTLTSKEDSLARQYIDLKKTKENLENIALSVGNLNTRLVEESSKGGIYTGKVNVFLRDILLGSLDWRIPMYLSRNREARTELNFVTESIDYVKVASDERSILRSFGERIRVQAKLTSPSATLEIQPDKNEMLQQVGERDRASWNWKIINRGTQDSRILLSLQLLNKNADAIPLFQHEELVATTNMVRQIRNYLQLIPLAIGILIGFILLGIVGIFRRGKAPRISPEHTLQKQADSVPYVNRKQL